MAANKFKLPLPDEEGNQGCARENTKKIMLSIETEQQKRPKAYLSHLKHLWAVRPTDKLPLYSNLLAVSFVD